MPKFGKDSMNALSSCDSRLYDIFIEVVKNYDCKILEGHRGEAAQNKAFSEGRSKLPWPKGQHNKLPSLALDVAPFPVDWKDTNRFYHFAGYVKRIAEEKGINIRWGGDWDQDNDFKDNKFDDLVHFEIKE